MKGENVDRNIDMPTLKDLVVIGGTITTLEKTEISLYNML